MKRKGTWLIVSVLVVLGLLAGSFGCAEPEVTPPPTPPPTPAEPEVIKWQGQSAYTPSPPDPRFPGYRTGPGADQAQSFYVDWLKQRTDGRLEIDVAPAGSIVPVADMITSVEKGVLDFAGTHYAGFHSGLIPEANIEVGLPFAWEIPEEAYDGLHHWGLQDIFEEVYAEHNAWPVPFGMGAVYHFGTNFPVYTPDAMKGKKIRAGAGIYADYIAALGGSATIIPWGELYMAAKLGTIDGYLGGPSGLQDVKLKEVLGWYVVKPNTNTVLASLYFNLDSLNALPEDIRDIILNDSKYVMAAWSQEYYIASHRFVPMSYAEGYTEPVEWSVEDTAKVTAIGIGLWDKVAAVSPRCKEMVDIIKEQMKDLGKM